MKYKYTHNGWFMFCPVKFADMDTEVPTVSPRWWFLLPLFWVARVAQQLVILLCTIFVADYQPHWYFLITGERK